MQCDRIVVLFCLFVYYSESTYLKNDFAVFLSIALEFCIVRRPSKFRLKFDSRYVVVAMRTIRIDMRQSRSLEFKRIIWSLYETVTLHRSDWFIYWLFSNLHAFWTFLWSFLEFCLFCWNFHVHLDNWLEFYGFIWWNFDGISNEFLRTLGKIEWNWKFNGNRLYGQPNRMDLTEFPRGNGI